MRRLRAASSVGEGRSMSCWWQSSIAGCIIIPVTGTSSSHHYLKLVTVLLSLLSPAPRQRGTQLSSFWLWELYYATVRQKTQLLLPSNRLNPQLRPWVVWPVSWLFCGELIINHREELQRWYVSSEHGASQITNNLLQGKSKTVIIPSTLCAQF